MPCIPVSVFWAPLVGVLYWTRTRWSGVEDKKLKERARGRERNRETERERERRKERKEERKKDTETQALMEQRCFNDFSVSIYKL